MGQNLNDLLSRPCAYPIAFCPLPMALITRPLQRDFLSHSQPAITHHATSVITIVKTTETGATVCIDAFLKQRQANAARKVSILIDALSECEGDEMVCNNSPPHKTSKWERV